MFPDDGSRGNIGAVVGASTSFAVSAAEESPKPRERESGHGRAEIPRPARQPHGSRATDAISAFPCRSVSTFDLRALAEAGRKHS